MGLKRNRWHLFFWAVILFLFTSRAYALSALFTDMSTTPQQITFSFDKPVQYKIFTLANPNRLVIDFQNTLYALSKKPDFSQTPISDFRHGIHQGLNLRIVFDLKNTVKYQSSTNQGKNFNVVLVLDTPKSEEIKPTEIKTTEIVKSITAVTPQVSTAPAEKVIAVKAIEKKTTPKFITGYSPKHKFVVIIDAGHGGKDPGTIGPNGVDEKNVTLAIAKDLQALVEKQPDMKPVMTRKGDYYVGLRQRLLIARKAKGDIFIAIHADAFSDPNAAGASVFALSLHGASSEAARWLAQKENYSELGGIDLNNVSEQDAQLRSVLIDLSQTATIGASLQLGRDVIKQLGKITPLHHGVVEQAPFMVLKSPDIPSILVETGFLSNPKEEARLRTPAYQQKIAEALMAGIQEYFDKTAPRNVSVMSSV